MRTWLKRVGWIAMVVPLAGCSVLPDAYTGCDEVQPYELARQAEPLRVPAGADLPDTRNALRIPELKGPEFPREPGSCLEHPPTIATGAAATAGADEPTKGVAEKAAADRAPEPARDDGRP